MPAVRCTINTTQSNYTRSITWACTPVYSNDIALNRDLAVVHSLRDTRSFSNITFTMRVILVFLLLSIIFSIFQIFFPIIERVSFVSIHFQNLANFFVPSFHASFLSSSNLVRSFPHCLIIPTSWLVFFLPSSYPFQPPSCSILAIFLLRPSLRIFI